MKYMMYKAKYHSLTENCDTKTMEKNEGRELLSFYTFYPPHEVMWKNISESQALSLISQSRRKYRTESLTNRDRKRPATILKRSFTC
jgi:hypothetical protein